jgi:hypothetical protein
VAKVPEIEEKSAAHQRSIENFGRAQADWPFGRSDVYTQIYTPLPFKRDSIYHVFITARRFIGV